MTVIIVAHLKSSRPSLVNIRYCPIDVRSVNGYPIVNYPVNRLNTNLSSPHSGWSDTVEMGIRKGRLFIFTMAKYTSSKIAIFFWLQNVQQRAIKVDEFLLLRRPLERCSSSSRKSFWIWKSVTSANFLRHTVKISGELFWMTVFFSAFSSPLQGQREALRRTWLGVRCDSRSVAWNIHENTAFLSHFATEVYYVRKFLIFPVDMVALSGRSCKCAITPEERSDFDHFHKNVLLFFRICVFSIGSFLSICDRVCWRRFFNLSWFAQAVYQSFGLGTAGIQCWRLLLISSIILKSISSPVSKVPDMFSERDVFTNSLILSDICLKFTVSNMSSSR